MAYAMYRSLRNLARPTLQRLFIVMAGPPVARLCNAPDSLLKCVGTAVRKTLRGSLSPNESASIRRIEDLRRRLCSSSDPLVKTDYSTSLTGVNRSATGRTQARTVGETCKMASKPYFGALLLYNLIREFKPSSCVELGTCLGISAAFQATALKFNGRGHLITLEGAESLASRARDHLSELALDNVSVVTGKFQDTLDGVLHGEETVDYAFIDGHHDERATLQYFRQILPFLAPRALLVFDDISWTPGMRRAWTNIIADRRVKVSIDLRNMGICAFSPGAGEPRHLRIPLL
jgi:predicted O-methyltransferase YrrM